MLYGSGSDNKLNENLALSLENVQWDVPSIRRIDTSMWYLGYPRHIIRKITTESRGNLIYIWRMDVATCLNAVFRHTKFR